MPAGQAMCRYKRTTSSLLPMASMPGRILQGLPGTGRCRAAWSATVAMHACWWQLALTFGFLPFPLVDLKVTPYMMPGVIWPVRIIAAARMAQEFDMDISRVLPATLWSENVWGMRGLRWESTGMGVETSWFIDQKDTLLFHSTT